MDIINSSEEDFELVQNKDEISHLQNQESNVKYIYGIYSNEITEVYKLTYNELMDYIYILQNMWCDDPTHFRYIIDRSEANTLKISKQLRNSPTCYTQNVVTIQWNICNLLS